MIFFNHMSTGGVPEILRTRGVIAHQGAILSYLLLDDKEQKQTDPPRWVADEDGNFEIIRELSKISKWKCAFCEQKRNLHILRFRPHPDDLGSHSNNQYLWLYWHWKNLFPICERCNEYAMNQVEFPVRGEQIIPTKVKIRSWYKRLDSDDGLAAIYEDLKSMYDGPNSETEGIYKPGKDAINPHKHWKISTKGILSGYSKTGIVQRTIDYFGLNREELVRRRRKALLEYMDVLFDELKHANYNLLHADNFSVFDFEKMEFGGAWFLLLYRVGQEFNRSNGTNYRIGHRQFRNTIFRRWHSHEWMSISEVFDRLDREYDKSDDRDIPGPIGKARGLVDPGKNELVSVSTKVKYMTHAPRLRRIKIKNFKSLESIDISLSKAVSMTSELRPPCLILIGENSTGKSSLLEAIAMAAMGPDSFRELVDSSSIKPEKVVLDKIFMGGFLSDSAKKLRSFPKRKADEAQVFLDFEDRTKRRLKIKPKSGDVFRSSKHISSREEHLIFAYGAHRLFSDTSSQNLVIRTDGENNEKNSINIDHSKYVVTLFRNDIQLRSPMSWLASLAKTDPESLNQVVRALRHIIQIEGHFKNIEVKKHKGGDDECIINLYRLGDNKKGYTVPIPLEYVSSGYRVIISLVCDVLRGIMERLKVNAKSARRTSVIVLIDEVEAHLHPRWKLSLVNGLREAIRGATFIFSTHDPLCLRGMEDDEIVMLNRYTNDHRETTFAEGQSCDSELREVVEAVSDTPKIKNMTVEQMLTSDLFQLLTTDVGENNTSEDFSAWVESEDLSKRIKGSLPIWYGSTEVEYLIQEAVHELLLNRRSSSSKTVRKKVRKEFKEKVKKILSESRNDQSF